jgi:hypothetical protein
MNKIETAIYEAKLELKELERENYGLIAKLQMKREQIESLEAIARDKSIPYGGDK